MGGPAGRLCRPSGAPLSGRSGAAGPWPAGTTLGVVRRPAVLLLLAVVAAVLAGACVPQTKGPLKELDPDGRDAPAPTFPSSGRVTVAMAVDGLVFDLTQAPPGIDLWVPPVRQARCAARRVVTALGADRLVDLGYRPGDPAAALNRLDLSSTERSTVAAAMSACVDVEQAVGSLLAGNNLLPGKAAACVARGLEEGGQLAPFMTAWAFREPVDVFGGENGGLASAMLSYADVCVADTSFNWTLRPSTTTTAAPTTVPGR